MTGTKRLFAQALDGIGMSLNFVPGTNIPVVVDLTPGKVAERCGKIKIGMECALGNDRS